MEETHKLDNRNDQDSSARPDNRNGILYLVTIIRMKKKKEKKIECQLTNVHCVPALCVFWHACMRVEYELWTEDTIVIGISCEFI